MSHERIPSGCYNLEDSSCESSLKHLVSNFCRAQVAKQSPRRLFQGILRGIFLGYSRLFGGYLDIMLEVF